MPLPLSLTSTVETSTGHRLMDYNGKCAHLHGHNYLWSIEIGLHDALPNASYGLLVDFGDLKNELKLTVEPLDHAMVVRFDDPVIPFLQRFNQRHAVLNVNPTAENLAGWAAWQLSQWVRNTYDTREYTVWCTLTETRNNTVRATANPDVVIVTRRRGDAAQLELPYDIPSR